MGFASYDRVADRHACKSLRAYGIRHILNPLTPLDDGDDSANRIYPPDARGMKYIVRWYQISLWSNADRGNPCNESPRDTFYSAGMNRRRRLHP